MKNVLLKIYPELNLGDDLFLKIILERYKASSFYLLAKKDEYHKFTINYDNLNVIDRLENITIVDRIILKFSSLFPVYIKKIMYKNYLSKQYGSIINEADLFVTIGGSMFIENTKLDFQKNLVFYRLINKKFKAKDKYYLGCNFGPYESGEFLNSFRKIFKDATDLSFRENSSKEALNLDKIRINPDIVFNLNTESNIFIPNTIGFVLVDPTLKFNKEINKENYINTIRDIIKYYIERQNKIYLFSFCKKELDEELIHEILDDKSINHSKIEKVFYDGNIEDFLKVYSSVEKIFAGRFHSMILSMKYNQKMLPLIYSNKMTNILPSVNFKGNYINIDDLNSDNIQLYDQYIINNTYNIDGLKKNAENNFYFLDKIIK